MSRGGPAARKKAAYQARVAAIQARLLAADNDLERARRSPSHDDRDAWPAWQRAATDAWIATHPDDEWIRRPKPGHQPTVDEIVRRAERLRSAMTGVEPTWRLGPNSAERRLADAQVGFFHEQMAGLYGPIGEAIAATTAAPTAEAMEILVRFLEANVYCFRSGYITADVIDALRRTTLSAPIAARLRHVVLSAVDSHDRREFRAFCRLATTVRDDWLVGELTERLESSQARAARHAQWVLDAIAAAGR
jgi:hypothetical protein